MPVKKFIYLLLATLGGALLGFLLHALLELWYIPRLVTNYGFWGLGLSWNTWFKIHELLVIILTLGGAAAGAGRGKLWWQYIYVERRYAGLVKSLRG